MPAFMASESSILMNPSTSFSSGTMRRSISNCCFRLASWRSISANFGRYASSSAFSRTLLSRACCAASLASRWLLNMVKYRAAVNNTAPATTTPHCLRPDISLKLVIIFRLLGLGLFAGQSELKCLHFFKGVVLVGLFDLNILEKTGLLQIGHQVGDGICTQSHAFNVHTRA